MDAHACYSAIHETVRVCDTDCNNCASGVLIGHFNEIHSFPLHERWFQSERAQSSSLIKKIIITILRNTFCCLQKEANKQQMYNYMKQ